MYKNTDKRYTLPMKNAEASVRMEGCQVTPQMREQCQRCLLYTSGVSTANFTWYDQNGQPLQERLTFIVRKAAPYFKDDCTPADYLLVPTLPKMCIRDRGDNSTIYHYTGAIWENPPFFTFF